MDISKEILDSKNKITSFKQLDKLFAKKDLKYELKCYVKFSDEEEEIKGKITIGNDHPLPFYKEFRFRYDEEISNCTSCTIMSNSFDKDRIRSGFYIEYIRLED